MAAGEHVANRPRRSWPAGQEGNVPVGRDVPTVQVANDLPDSLGK